MRCQSAAQYARLAQLVEHLLDVQEVTGSSPVPRTKIDAQIRKNPGVFRFWWIF